MLELTKDQKKILRSYIEPYKKWLATTKGQENVKEHRKHSNFFKQVLAKENIDNIDEAQFSEIYKNLWASNIWSNKNWYIKNKLLKRNNGLMKIKEELKKLLYGEGDIATRIDNFWDQIDGIGPSSLSEILHLVFPDKYCLWNCKPKTVLPLFNIDQLNERFYKSNLRSGSDYERCNEVVNLIKNELKELEFNDPDFIDVDCFLYYTFINIPRTIKNNTRTAKKDIKSPQIEKIDSHEAAEFYLLKLGELLGYLSYTADSAKFLNNKKLGDIANLKDMPDFASQKDKNSAREIDVIWFDEMENPKYCFEVENTTDITKGVNRMLQLQAFTVTFIIVAPEEKRSKFISEMKKAPNRVLLKGRCKFISYQELEKLFKSAQKFRELKDKFLGS